MVDRWTRTPFKHSLPPGYTAESVARWVAAMNASEQMLVQRTREAKIWLVGEGDQVDAHSDPGYGGGCIGKKEGASAETSLLAQLQLARQGQGLLASYHPAGPNPADPAEAAAAFQSQLASFLIGAGERHYFGAGSWTCNATSREGVTWHDEYDRPLGAPLGLAEKGGDGVWRRSFSAGTNVSFDSRTGLGAIRWGALAQKTDDMQHAQARDGNCSDARSFGARGDGVTNDTAALQSAIHACSTRRQALVITGGGTFRITPLGLRSNLHLVVDEDTTLRADNDTERWPLGAPRETGRGPSSA